MSDDRPTLVHLPVPGSDLVPGMLAPAEETETALVATDAGGAQDAVATGVVEPTTVTPAGPAQPNDFDVVLRGYERHQVDRYVYRVSTLVAEQNAQLADLAAREAAASAELAECRRELETGRPSFDALGGRVSKMLTLAESEAAQLRADAEHDAKALRHASEREAADIRSEASREAEELGAAARREVAELSERRVKLLTDIAAMRDALNTVLGGATEQWPSLAPIDITAPSEEPTEPANASSGQTEPGR